MRDILRITVRGNRTPESYRLRHSGIRYVTPAQRHRGDDHALLAARHALYTEARARNPARWSGDTRNWSPTLVVTLNPERDDIINTHLNGGDTLPSTSSLTRAGSGAHL